MGRVPASRDPNPYYRTLYGDAFPRYQQMALTLALLFDELVIVPADAFLPGAITCQRFRPIESTLLNSQPPVNSRASFSAQP